MLPVWHGQFHLLPPPVGGIMALISRKRAGCFNNIEKRKECIAAQTETSEAQLARDMGIAQTTLQSQKYKILEKLKKML